MHPRDAKSPAWRIAPDSLEVVHVTPEWSLARMTYDGQKNSLGIRWNGDLNDRNALGYPNARGHGAWFILPDGLDDLIAAAVGLPPKLPQTAA